MRLRRAGRAYSTTPGMERSFAAAVDDLKLGAGEEFHGEAIVALAKALLQSGISYIGGYPGAPISHLMDVLADARAEVLQPLGVHYESSASEAGAAALLGASIHYPLRGVATWKSIVGTNVAADALSNLASAGVTGGCLIIVGEDYGEGASVIQERTHAIALKSSLPLLDPRTHIPTLVRLAEKAFDLSEASRLPVMMSLRIRAIHMSGSFVCKDNRPSPYHAAQPLAQPLRDYGRIVLSPSTYAHERAKIEERLPAARRFILEHQLNEQVEPSDVAGKGTKHRGSGIIMQGGVYATVLRSLRRLGLADAFGRSQLPLLVLNVIHPLVPEEIEGFLRDMDHVLVVEEGTPPFIEQEVRAIAQMARSATEIAGKGFLPAAGEYSAEAVHAGLRRWLHESGALPEARETGSRPSLIPLPVKMPPRPPGFCTGCPERPVFTALKLFERERGPMHISMDIGCNTFATLPPFNLGSTVLGYGMSMASSGAVAPALDAPAIVVMGDGGFWHNGLVTGALNAHWHGYDAVLIILENGYASATGQQHLPSTGSTPWGRPVHVSVERTLRGLGIDWVRRINAYDLEETMAVLQEALDARGPQLRVIISDQECMLAQQRRARRRRQERNGQPEAIVRFGVDEEICTGDHVCMRLSGCPALTLRPARDPLKDGPTTMVDGSCVGCELCGALAHADALCPSFYRARRIANPGLGQRVAAGLNALLLRLVGAT